MTDSIIHPDCKFQDGYNTVNIPKPMKALYDAGVFNPLYKRHFINDKTSNLSTPGIKNGPKFDREWMLIKDYFYTRTVADHQLRSFNYFVNSGIQSIIDKEPTIRITNQSDGGKFLSGSEYEKYTLTFGSVFVETPVHTTNLTSKKVMPHQAKMNSLEYSGRVLCNVTEKIVNIKTGETKRTRVLTRVHIASIPIMIHSCKCNLFKLSKPERVKAQECPYEIGGYFLIKGARTNEKVLISQIRNSYNEILVLPSKDKYKFVAKLRSMSKETLHSVQFQLAYNATERRIYARISTFDKPLCIGILFKALGITHDKLMDIMLCYHKTTNLEILSIINTIIHASISIQNQKDVLYYIGKQLGDIDDAAGEAKKIIKFDILPHLGISATQHTKALYIGLIVKKLLFTIAGEGEVKTKSCNLRRTDNIDALHNKRIENAGILCEDLFTKLYKKLLSKLEAILDSRTNISNLESIIEKAQSITSGFKTAFLTGNWGIVKNKFTRVGVSQIRNTTTWGSKLSHTRRMTAHIGEGNAVVRKLEATHAGFICPLETPEGGNAGAVLNHALLSIISIPTDAYLVRNVVERIPSYIHPDGKLVVDSKQVSILLDGSLVGFTTRPVEFTRDYRTRRINGQIHSDTSISCSISDAEIKIYTDSGRMLTPLMVVDTKTRTTKFDQLHATNVSMSPQKYKSTVLNWKYLIEHDIIRYIDSCEILDHVVAFDKERLETTDIKFDYCHIHPSCVLGILGNVIPFPINNPSPRNCYQTNMGQQSIGHDSLNSVNSMYTTVKQLHYAQKPLVSTEVARILHFDDLPCGVNAVMWVLAEGGYDQEDSMVFSQKFVQFGGLTMSEYRTIMIKEEHQSSQIQEKIEYPPEHDDNKGGYKRRNVNYSLLDKKTGVIRHRYATPSDADKKLLTQLGIQPDMCNPSKTGCTQVKTGDILVGKVLTTINNRTGVVTKTDKSYSAKKSEQGWIDNVRITTVNGVRTVIIRIRKIRIPRVGDKFKSRYSQKGTVGRIVSAEDMPYTADGMQADIIINPHCMPTRMTVGMMYEMGLGKLVAQAGIPFGDATPFYTTTIKTSDIFKQFYDKKTLASQILRDQCNQRETLSNGFESKDMRDLNLECMGGSTIMYSGLTGEPMPGKAYIGILHMQRLIHHVEEKIHARAFGKLTQLHHQPVAGRVNGGGLRFGGMEVDVCVSHGCVYTVKDRLLFNSDYFEIPVCRKCCSMSSNRTRCKGCKGNNVVMCVIPYATKLLIDYLYGIGIKIRYKIQD